MKVLLQNRSNFLTSLAGDSVQLVKTKESLEKLGVDVTISSSDRVDLHEFDLIHLFNLMPIEETYHFFENAEQYQKKIVLSTIYWDPLEFLRMSGQMDSFGVWWQKTHPLREKVLAGTCVILPNSQLELELLRQNFARLPQAAIVPNAADAIFGTARPDRFRRKHGSDPFVLSVGRICRRKNQLQLIQAMKGLKLPLVFIGPINDGAYYLECRKAAAGNPVKFIPEMTPLELASAYAAARVHALVSWYDTPGLVSLEAVLAGCQIVTTDRGSAREYFGASVFYCDPADSADIAQKIGTAWLTPVQPGFRTEIGRKFSWEEAARQTYHAYCQALDG